MKSINEHIKSIGALISDINVVDAFAEVSKGELLIDIRENDEVASGSPINALRISKGMLEMQIQQHAEDSTKKIMLLCASGKRSLLAAHSLMLLGYSDVRSVSGGFTEWKNKLLPFEMPKSIGKDDLLRYKRHILIPEIGEKGQMKLLMSKILIVGVGGIGSPVALYLAAAGIGTIGIIDGDVVDKSNLQRQVLFTENDIGHSKAKVAKETLSKLNSSIKVNVYEERLTIQNAEDIISKYDVVIDGTDNFETRYLINDACVKLKIPNVHGSVYLFEGQFATFWPASNYKNAPCYRCLFPEPPPIELAPNCAEAGVLGVLPGIIGMLCATEAIKIILELGALQIGRLLVYDALKMEVSELEANKKDDCPYCSCTDAANYPAYKTYSEYCVL